MPALDADELASCIDERRFEDAVAADYELGQQAGVDGTPSLFVNGQKLESWGFEAVQAAVAVARLAGGARPEETATFLGYLAGALLIPVLGVLWARSDPSRWAGTVIGVAALTVAVMVWRLLQLWGAAGA